MTDHAQTYRAQLTRPRHTLAFALGAATVAFVFGLTAATAIPEVVKSPVQVVKAKAHQARPNGRMLSKFISRK